VNCKKQIPPGRPEVPKLKMYPPVGPSEMSKRK
jgi:hypothetical protein